MKVLQSVFYKEFKCIGNECIDNCCHGWKITIDKKTFFKYKKIRGEFGNRINSSMSRNRKNTSDNNYGKFDLKNGKCRFLNKDSLCEIYINKGETYMCNTCKMYPRTIIDEGFMCKGILTASCPVVADYLISEKNKMEFEIIDSNLEDYEIYKLESKKYNNDLLNFYWELRGFLIEIAQFEEVQLWKRLVLIKFIEEKLDNDIKNSKYQDGMITLENLRNIITDEGFLNSFDEIEGANKVKILFIRSILQSKESLSRGNKNIIEFINAYNSICDENKDEEIWNFIDKKEARFNEYIKDREYILENYLVHNIFNFYGNVLNTKNLNKEVVRTTISIAIIKLMLLTLWHSKDEKLTDEDIRNVLYSFSRLMEHDERFITTIYNRIAEAGYDTMAYLTILVR